MKQQLAKKRQEQQIEQFIYEMEPITLKYAPRPNSPELRQELAAEVYSEWMAKVNADKM